MKRTLLTTLIIAFSFYANGQNKKDNNLRNHYFEADAFFAGSFDENKHYTTNFSLGYEFKHPRFEYVGIKPQIGYFFSNYTSLDYEWREVWGQFHQVVDKVHYKFNVNAVYAGIAAKLYLPIESDIVSGLFASNDFNWAKCYAKARFPNQPMQPTISGNSDLIFHYTLKLGVTFASEDWAIKGLSIWAGGTTLKMKKIAETMIPKNYEIGSMAFFLAVGVSLSF